MLLVSFLHCKYVKIVHWHFHSNHLDLWQLPLLLLHFQYFCRHLHLLIQRIHLPSNFNINQLSDISWNLTPLGTLLSFGKFHVVKISPFYFFSFLFHPEDLSRRLHLSRFLRHTCLIFTSDLLNLGLLIPPFLVKFISEIDQSSLVEMPTAHLIHKILSSANSSF